MTAIQVSVRVRPFNSREVKYSSQLIIDMEGPQCSVKQVKQGKVTEESPRKFTFDHCFWTHVPGESRFDGQDVVYDTIGKTILDNSLNGFNSCLFAYGQTGSGKTYSMMGCQADPGVIPRLCTDLFSRAHELKDTNLIVVECSYLEIYNEQIRDLLNPAQNKTLKARQHPKLGVYVENLTKLSASSVEEINKFIDDGATIRSVAATNMNAQSSRSHAILTLRIRNKGKDGELASQLHLVDLAGSERAASTGASGDTLVEGASINKSLTTLGMCLSRLAEVAEGKKGHIPFRDSQLTWLLNDSLGGNSRTAMMANISPADINFEETLSTLRFAATTKRIKNHAVVNEDPQQRLIRELRAEIAAIKEQIGTLDAGLALAPREGEEGYEDYYYYDDEEGNTSFDRLAKHLTENINLMEEATLTAEERAEKDRLAKEERERAMAALMAQEDVQKQQKIKAKTLSVDATVPRIITLNEDLHALPTIALLYYLSEGQNWVGNDREGLILLPQSCVSKSDQLLSKHFSIDSHMLERQVTLQIPTEAEDQLTFHQQEEAQQQQEQQQEQEEPKEPPRSPRSPRTAPSAARRAAVTVNGVPVEAGWSSPLEGNARIVVGQVAFRFTMPSVWIQADQEEFSRQCTTFNHLFDLEHHLRGTIALEQCKEIDQLFVKQFAIGGEEGEESDGALPGQALLRAWLVEELRVASYHVGETETHMVNEYPLSDEAIMEAVEKAGDNAGLKYDYAFAMQERNNYLRERELELKVMERDAALNELQTQAEAKNAEIDQLKEELRKQEEASLALKEQRQQLRETSSVGSVVPLGGSPSPSQTFSAGSTSGAYVTPKTAGAQEKMKLAAQMAEYEETCREAKLWKPDGPSIVEDQPEYQLSLKAPTVGQVRALEGNPLLEFVVQKYRVKKGLFSRSGYHPVFVIVRQRFLHYFENDKDITRASGSVYLWGCEVQLLERNDKVAEGRPFCLRLIPCVPRKDSKASKGVSEENNVVLSFDSEELREQFKKLIDGVALPTVPPAVADYMALMSLQA